MDAEETRGTGGPAGTPRAVAGGPAAPDDMPLAGWGMPGRGHPVPDHAMRWLRGRLSLGPVTPGELPTAQTVPVPPSRLPDPARRALEAAVGAEHVRTDGPSRAGHAAGKSYLDLVRVRAGSLPAAPDAVVLPAGAGQVAAVLAACAAHGVAVVPFGGGTSVVGGVAPLRGRHASVVAVDLRRMRRLLSVDPVSRLATFEAGVRGPDLEAQLAPHGLTLGHLPQSFEHASLGGFVATRSAGQASSGFGRIEDLVVALQLCTPAGPWRLGRGAASAAGPDLRMLAVGSEGALGIITEVTVRVRPRAEHRHYEGRLVRSWAAGLELARRLVQDGVPPDVVRLSDPEETGVSLRLAAGGARGAALRGYARARSGRGPCLLILGWEGDARRVRARRAAARPALAGSIRLGRSAGDRWRRGRFDGPYQRDALLDAGVLVETLETSALWSGLPGVHAAVRQAIAGVLPGAVVMCHLSHLYPHGASLYFTVLAAADPADPAAQWSRAKRAAGDTLVAAGATITHHHATGTDHLPWLGAEIGELGIAVLRSAKQVLDPQGICNPGKLIPDAGS